MRVGRKDALIALVAGLVPLLTRRALAQTAASDPAQLPSPVPAPINPQTVISDLQKRVAALEAQLANQVAFTKDAAGNLTLNAPANVTLSSGAALSLKGVAQTTLSSQIIVKVTGATINLN